MLFERSGTRPGCPLSPHIIKILLEVLGRAIKQDKVQLLLFADDMILYVENTKESDKKLLELISNFSKVQDTKSTYKNQMHFLILMMKHLKKK